MRPKKRILMFATNEAEGQRIAFVLHCRGYAVRVTHTPDDYRAMLTEFRPDVALILFRGEGRPFATEAAELASANNTSVIVALMARNLKFDGLAHAIVQERQYGGFMAELVEQLRICCARRRGPKRADSLSQTRIAFAAHNAAAVSARLA